MNAIGTQLRDLINSELTPDGGLTVYVDAVAESGRNPVSKHQIYSPSMKVSRLTRDGTAESVS